MLPPQVFFVDVLRCMARIRVAELYIAKRYPEEIMRCPVHLSLGQEASAGILGALTTPKDVFLGSYRSHGQYLAKGGDLKALFAELLGREGCSGGLGGSPHICDYNVGFYGTSAIVGGHIPIAAGVALAKKRQKKEGIVVCFLGDAAMEEGVMYETINLSLLYKLPILFVCENNRQCVTTPLEMRTTHEELYQRFLPMKLYSKRVDGNDVSLLATAAADVLDFVRNGKGPAFLECLVARWAIHVGHTYEGPVDAWWQDPWADEAFCCPIARLARNLMETKMLQIADLKQIKIELDKEIEETFSVAEKISLPSVRVLEQAVYASGITSLLPKAESALQAIEGAHKEATKLVNPY